MPTKCPKCDLDNPDTGKFCSECGTQLISTDDIPAQTRTLDTPREELTRGTTFANRYDIIEELGRGGMGRVYRVDDTKVKEEVALKLIKPEVAADKKTIERFRNELKSARKIRHKNICQMFDLGEYEGIHFITMEYVTGEDLKSLIRRMKIIPTGTAVSITKQICEGLIEAHRIGIVHRDIKPSNIMIDKAGNAHIMDFGIARSTKSEALTGADVIIGTPDYMSPEQVEGKEIDQRSDIYSLGVVIFEMLTGERPFKGDTSLNVAMKHKSEVPPNPKWLNDQIPDRLSRLILMCLEKDKERRYQSAEELLSALNNIDEKKIHITDKDEKKKSIAVLPFTNMSADPEQEYFCDGMAEEIINSLTHIKNLRVIARTSSFAFKGKQEDIREIGRKLDVDTLLEGSVRKSGNRLRIMAQLINVADGSHLWSERYDRKMEDIFDIQDEMSLAIVDKLKVKLIEEEKASILKSYTENLEAYNLYIKGNYFSQMWTVEGFEKAIECYEQAIKKDPNYALAYTGMAEVYIYQPYFLNLPPKKASLKAKTYLKKSLDIDETLGEAHALLGRISTFYDWNWIVAEQKFKRALELNTNSSIIHFNYWPLLSITGQHEEAIIEAKRARELDPLSITISAGVGEVLYFASQFEEAIEDLQKTIAMDPNYYFSLLLLGLAYLAKSMIKESIVELEKACDLSDGAPIVVSQLAPAYYMSGKKFQADKLFNSLMDRAKYEYIPSTFFFMMHKVRGDMNQAFKWLERACEDRDIYLPFLLAYPDDIYRIPYDQKTSNLLKRVGLVKQDYKY